MTTTPVGAAAASAPSTNQLKSSTGYNLKAEDFIKMMVTQLQNQDPTQPVKNEELLAQMSQIGQLESSTMLQQSLQSMTLQSQIGSAGNLIGKSIQGLDDQSKAVAGQVNSVRVQDGQVYLELDSGKSLGLARVTHIAGPPSPTATPAAPAA